MLGESGVLYGTARHGGISASGMVFALSPPVDPAGAWTEAVLYNFRGGTSDGSEPGAGVVFGRHGALYGTTDYGGSNNLGTIFSLTPPVFRGRPWTETVLYTFTGLADGAFPTSTLVVGEDGVVYGTTVNGGYAGGGVVFALAP